MRNNPDLAPSTSLVPSGICDLRDRISELQGQERGKPNVLCRLIDRVIQRPQKLSWTTQAGERRKADQTVVFMNVDGTPVPVAHEVIIVQDGENAGNRDYLTVRRSFDERGETSSVQLLLNLNHFGVRRGRDVAADSPLLVSPVSESLELLTFIRDASASDFDPFRNREQSPSHITEYRSDALVIGFSQSSGVWTMSASRMSKISRCYTREPKLYGPRLRKEIALPGLEAAAEVPYVVLLEQVSDDARIREQIEQIGERYATLPVAA